MHKEYLYPENLRSQARLWLWNLRDVVIIIISLLLSILALVKINFSLPLVLTCCYGFLTIRHDDSTVLDFVKRGIRFFITEQQYYKWQEKNIESHGEVE